MKINDAATKNQPFNLDALDVARLAASGCAHDITAKGVALEEGAAYKRQYHTDLRRFERRCGDVRQDGGVDLTLTVVSVQDDDTVAKQMDDVTSFFQGVGDDEKTRLKKDGHWVEYPLLFAPGRLPKYYSGLTTDIWNSARGENNPSWAGDWSMKQEPLPPDHERRYQVRRGTQSRFFIRYRWVAGRRARDASQNHPPCPCYRTLGTGMLRSRRSQRR